MNRKLVLLFGAIITVVAIRLALVLLRPDHPANDAVTRAPAPSTPLVTRPVIPSSTGSAASGSDSGSSASADDAPSEYTVGGVRIRDHRAGTHAPIDVPPAIHVPGGYKVPSQLTSELSKLVSAAVHECSAAVPSDARGARPRIEGQIIIAIKDGRATITSAVLPARDVADSASAALRQCVEQRAIGSMTPSGNEPDIDRYQITLSLRV
jgi:hypothetical protein